MNNWQKALISGIVIELVLTLISGILLMSSVTPAGPEGFAASLSEWILFPGCQIMEKIGVESFPIAFLGLSAINLACWTAAAFVVLSLKKRATHTS